MGWTSAVGASQVCAAHALAAHSAVARQGACPEQEGTPSQQWGRATIRKRIRHHCSITSLERIRHHSALISRARIRHHRSLQAVHAFAATALS